MASSTLSGPIFAKISPHEYLLANLQPTDSAAQTVRTNGRAPDELRRPQVNTGSLSHAFGSAVVRNGDTAVICGVRGEILPVAKIPNYRLYRRRRQQQAGSEKEEDEKEGRRQLRDYNLLVPNIELATGSAPQFLPGVPPTALAQTLSTRVYSLLHSSRLLDAEDLRIWYTPPKTTTSTGDGNNGDEHMAEDNSGGNDDDNFNEEDEDGNESGPQLKAFWTLYIDMLFISYDGNAFDTAWAAMLAALRDTRLPRAWWDADREAVLCSRGSPASAPSQQRQRALTVRGLPIACTAAVLREREHYASGIMTGGIIGGQGREGGRKEARQRPSFLLLDPDRLEGALCEERITLVVDRSGGGGETRVRGITKSGGGVVGPAELRHLVGIAEKRWEDFQKAIEDEDAKRKEEEDVQMAM